MVYIILGFVIYIAFKILRNKISDNTERIKRLERRVLSPEEQVAPAVKPVDSWPGDEDHVSRPYKPEEEARKEEVFEAEKPPVEERPQMPQYRAAVSAPKKREPSEFEKMLQKLQDEFIENWTGILGSVIMVAGIGFLGIYGALKVTPFYRFLIITLFAVVLSALFVSLNMMSKWKQFSYWLGSSAAAIFLFACIGSGSIPGLQWIQNPLFGLGLLGFGILVNMLFAIWTASQTFVSLHTVLSLVALAIAPANEITLATATLVTVISTALSYRHKWDIHLLIIISSFFVYNILSFTTIEHYNLYAIQQAMALSPAQKIIGILCVLAVGVVAALVHYRKDYVAKKVEPLPLLVHMANWLFLGIGLLVYSTGYHYNTFCLAISSVLTFFLARKGRSLGIRWVYTTDTLIAQTLALLTIISLHRWNLNHLAISALAFIECMMFLFIMIKEEEQLFQRIGKHLVHALGIGIIIILAANPAFFSPTSINFTLSLMIIVLLISLTFYFYIHTMFGEGFDSYHIYTGKKDSTPHVSGLGAITCLFLVILYSLFFIHGSLGYHYNTFCLAIFSVLTFFLARKGRSLGIRWFYTTDTLIAQTLALLTIISLHR